MSTSPAVAEHGQLGHPHLVEHRLRLQPTVITVCPGVWTVFGLSLANAHVIAGKDGLIVVDAGHSGAEGAELRRHIRQVSHAPIRAVLLTHWHYVRGIASLLDGDAAAIIAHPRLHANVMRAQQSFTGLRNALETGARLPESGPHAVIARAPRWRDPSTYLPPTHTVLPGDTVQLAGLEVEVLEGCFDSDDGLAYRFPHVDAVAHNLITGQFPNFGSLAGGRYRDPLPWLQAVAALREHPPQHALPCHGLPISGRQDVAERFALNHEAIRSLYDQAQALAAAGSTIPDIIRQVQLPAHLAQHPMLRQIYGTADHAVRAFALGEMGFWSGEPRDLFPLHPDQEAQCLADLVGNPQRLLEAAQQAQEAPAWAMRLADAACRCGVIGAKAFRAQLLRQAAMATPAWTERNTMLSLAQNDDPQE